MRVAAQEQRKSSLKQKAQLRVKNWADRQEVDGVLTSCKRAPLLFWPVVNNSDPSLQEVFTKH